jgi:hypothetical protein
MGVMAGLVPATHALLMLRQRKTPMVVTARPSRTEPMTDPQRTNSEAIGGEPDTSRIANPALRTQTSRAAIH